MQHVYNVVGGIVFTATTWWVSQPFILGVHEIRKLMTISKIKQYKKLHPPSKKFCKTEFTENSQKQYNKSHILYAVINYFKAMQPFHCMFTINIYSHSTMEKV